jgi:hypothetical protein
MEYYIKKEGPYMLASINELVVAKEVTSKKVELYS